MKYAIVILFLSTSFSIAADDEASKKLLKDLEGFYKLTGGESSGEPLPALDIFEKISIKGDKFRITVKGEKGELITIVATISVDASKKITHFDLKKDDGPKKDEASLGIIAIDGDTIKICSSKPGNKRPTEFKTSKDDKNASMTLKKIKD